MTPLLSLALKYAPALIEWGATQLGKLRRPKAPPSQPLTWKDVERQQAQIKSSTSFVVTPRSQVITQRLPLPRRDAIPPSPDSQSPAMPAIPKGSKDAWHKP